MIECHKHHARYMQHEVGKLDLCYSSTLDTGRLSSLTRMLIDLLQRILMPVDSLYLLGFKPYVMCAVGGSEIQTNCMSAG